MEPSETPSEPVIRAAADFAPDWPDDVRLLCARLFQQFTPVEIEGRARLGDLAFDGAPAQVERLQAIVGDLSKEAWGEIAPGIRDQIGAVLQEVLACLEEMIDLSSSSETPADRRATLSNQLADRLAWFENNVAPFTTRAKFERFAGGMARTPQDDVEDVREEVRSLKVGIGALQAELSSSKEAVNEARKTAGSSASEELQSVYKTLAGDYAGTANRWMWALGGSLILGFIAALLTYHAVRPDGEAKNAHDYAALGFGVFVLGLIAFVIRVCAQNLRINRHLAAVARSKASAISTFQRLTTSVSDEAVRSAVTMTLAQAIFTVEDTGLTDSSGDHVTLVERAVLPSLPTARTPG